MNCKPTRPRNNMPSRIPAVFHAFRPHLLLGALLAAGCLSGCKPGQHWDKEFDCAGRESSSSYFVDDDPALAIRKDYPISVDLHLRSDTVLIRTFQTHVDSSNGAVLNFSAKNSGAWINGQFDQQSGQLTLVEEKTLKIAGRMQQVRTSGQYSCKP